MKSFAHKDDLSAIAVCLCYFQRNIGIPEDVCPEKKTIAIIGNRLSVSGYENLRTYGLLYPVTVDNLDVVPVSVVHINEPYLICYRNFGNFHERQNQL